MVLCSNISSVLNTGLCTGCGICQNVCTSQAITILQKNGLNIPIVDNSLCTKCGICLKICGGKSVDLKSESDLLFSENEIKTDYYIGKYISCYSGFSVDFDIRFHSASGGVLSQFLIYLLEKKIIQGAVVVRFDINDLTSPKVFIAQTKEDILLARSSKYCPVSFDGIFNAIKEFEGKVVIVELPCHTHSIRKYEKINKKVKEKIIGHFSLYCSGTKTMFSQEYLFKKYNIEKSKLVSFSYRDDGCLGYLKAVQTNNVIKIPYKDYYLSMRGFFTPTRCTTCVDHYGELADISFGDIHFAEYSKDKIGVNSIITRNIYWDTLLQNAKIDGYIALDIVTSDTINLSQKYVKIHKKGDGVYTALKIRKYFGKAIPKYDIIVSGKITLKQIIRYFAHIFSRLIGRNRNLWFLINYIDIIALFLKVGERRKE